MFKDIDIFCLAAQAILQGRDPYSLPGVEVFYPLPFYFLFLPLAVLPLPLVHVLWTCLNAVVLVGLLQRRALVAVLFVPVLLTILLGQVDLIMMGLLALLRTGLAGGIALAFLILKPHLLILLAPWLLWRWWQQDRRQILWFALVLGILTLASFAVEPDWPLRLYARSGERVRAGISSSVWGLFAFLPTPVWLGAAGLVVCLLAVWALRSSNIDLVAAVGVFISPFVFSHNLAFLAVSVNQVRDWLGLVVLSWMTFALSAWLVNDRAGALLTLALIVLLWRQKSVAARISRRSHTMAWVEQER